MSNLVLSFANINVGVVFEKESLARVFKTYIIEQIKLNYGSLIIKTAKNTKIHYKIVFQDTNIIKQIQQKNKHFYAHFYSKVGRYTYKTYYHISPVQFQSLLHLILYDRAHATSLSMLHSSANLINNKSALFIGKPGNGKTTIMKMLSQKYIPLADDSFILDKNKQNYISYQTPFAEKVIINKIITPIPLGGIYFLKQSKSYSIQHITDKNYIFKTLLQNCLIDDMTNIKIYLDKMHKLAFHFENFYLVEFGLNEKKLIPLFDNK